MFNILNNTQIIIEKKNNDDLLSFLDDEEYQILENNGFLIEEKTVETSIVLQQAREDSQESKEGLYVHLYLTMFCNFRCTYCFENKNILEQQSISDMTEKKIIDFLEKKIRSSPKFIEIIWFGGEPLLEIDKMMRLNKILKNLAEECGVSYSSQISTNGYYLEKMTVKMKNELNLTDINVSMDGLAETHNKRRPHNNINNLNSFDKILKNILKMKNDFDFTINLIVDTTNSEEVIKLLSLLDKHSFFEKNSFRLSFVTNNTGVVNLQEVKTLTRYIYRNILDMNLELKMKNFFPMNLKVRCAAQLQNVFHIRPDGMIYRCIHDVTKLNNDYIYNLETKEINKDRLNDFDNSLYNYNKECENCLYFPLCFGGCPAENIRNKLEKKDCTQWKYMLEDIIILKAKKLLRTYYE